MDTYIVLINGIIITKVRACDKWNAIDFIKRLSDDPCFFDCSVFGEDIDYEEIPEYTKNGVRYIEYDTIKLIMEQYKYMEGMLENYTERKVNYDSISPFIKDYEILSLITGDICHMAKSTMDKIYRVFHE